VCDANGGSSRATQRSSPLHIASACGDVALMAELIRLGAKLTSFNPQHVAPLHLAAQHSAAAVRTLVAAGAPTGARDGRKQSMVHHAARVGCVEVLELVASDGLQLDLFARDRWQRTPVHWAVLNDHVHFLRYYAAYAASPQRGGDVQQAAARKLSQTVRLAGGSTHVPYETPVALAARLYGADSEMARLCGDVGVQ
jgi:ankyrin repeat protein